MAKNQSSQNPSRSSCEKIRKATFGRFRRADPSSSSKSHVSYTQPTVFLNPIMSNEIPIEYVPPMEAKSVKNVRFSANSTTYTDNKTSGNEMAHQNTFSESKFDSFIGRMKMKMSAPSDVGGPEPVRHDSFNDKVSNFIDRTKLKMKATSSMGANGENVSFKRDY